MKTFLQGIKFGSLILVLVLAACKSEFRDSKPIFKEYTVNDIYSYNAKLKIDGQNTAILLTWSVNDSVTFINDCKFFDEDNFECGNFVMYQGKFYRNQKLATEVKTSGS